MNQKVVVTSYEDPDLDGFAGAIAYAELLNKTGTPAVVRFFGTPHFEATYLVGKFGFDIQTDPTADLSRIILVDASELHVLNSFVNAENVIEVIDHRPANDAHAFINAKIQIEFVGAAATLIAEKFHQQNIEISAPSATLLYGAIVSNTLNFRAKVTTDRDRAMAEWLNSKLGLGKEFVDDMFRAKSDVSGEKLAQRIEADFACPMVGEERIGFGQLEITDVKPLLETRKEEVLQILSDEKAKEKLGKVFISFIDLGEGFNAFVTDDTEMQGTLSKILSLKFENNVAYRDGYIMRKEIVPLLRENEARKN